jgi:cytochrome c553
MPRSTLPGLVCLLGCAVLSAACSKDLVEQVPTEVCASGERWAGELTPSEEMYPGRDCVGCHRDNDGPQLLVGGTVYGVLDPDGARTRRNDCFGVEGARVTLTAADGLKLEMVTNRAGNFYFEGGDNSALEPFGVVVELTLPDGRQSRQQMASRPSYGGCARCHGAEAESTPGAAPGKELHVDDVIAGVFPIFTGPVSE